MKTLLKNAQVLVDDQLEQRDILIQDDQIKSISATIDPSEDTEVIDLAGQFVSPGLVDVHVHLREPGYTNKETVATGSHAAAHGGFTTIGAMANLNPTTDTPENMQRQLELNQQAVVKIAQYSPVTKGRAGEELNDYAALQEAGAFAFSDDGSGIANALVMEQAMKRIAAVGGILADHAQDMDLTNGGVINAGPTAEKFAVPGNPGVSETTQIARNLVLAQETGVHYHVCHVSTMESVALVAFAKSQGLNVTCEVAPHHLLLDDTMILTDDGNYKMNPPLRRAQDREACIAGLLDGVIDIIATDHAPHTDAEKKQGLLKSPNGIVGSENAFELLYTKFVKPGIFTLAQLVSWMSTKPAEIFKLGDAGNLSVSSKADLAVFDLVTRETIQTSDLLSKGHNTPFLGQETYGQTTLTMVDGKIVYRRNQNEH